MSSQGRVKEQINLHDDAISDFSQADRTRQN